MVRICDTIGEGAFSFVYTAQETNSSRVASGPSQFALKKMILQSTEFERCALSEVNSFNRFQHSNILPLLDHVSLLESGSDGQVKVMYMLFPLMEKGSLRDVLNRQLTSPNSSLPSLSEVLFDFISICEALNVLHSFKPAYVHQDLKPENIVIGGDGRPYLMDFGSVRLADVPIKDRSKALKVAEDAATYCTVSYRAPELFDPPTGLLLDTRTDVWSAGCLLFAWYYGYSPYECEFTEEDAAPSSAQKTKVGRASLRVVESSHLRVLSPPPKRPEAVATEEDRLLSAEMEAVLIQDISQRPFLSDVMHRLQKVMSSMPYEGSSNSV